MKEIVISINDVFRVAEDRVGIDGWKAFEWKRATGGMRGGGAEAADAGEHVGDALQVPRGRGPARDDHGSARSAPPRDTSGTDGARASCAVMITDGTRSGLSFAHCS